MLQILFAKKAHSQQHEKKRQTRVSNLDHQYSAPRFLATEPL